MKARTGIVLILGFIFFWSCSEHKAPRGFNSNLWRKDTNGCLGLRIGLADSILKYKADWKSMDDDFLLELLGTPERKFYYERNAKAFLYYVQPGRQCLQGTKEGQKLIAEINAIGFVSIIRVEP